MPSRTDPEIEAIGALIAALDPLDADARGRVLIYALGRLGMTSPIDLGGSDFLTQAPEMEIGRSSIDSTWGQADIRSLRNEKEPKSATEMAALVAYYLAELATEDERKLEVSTADVEKYFKQAGHRLPNVPAKTLGNAAAAGYFDSVGRGKYRLNPVGYNLVAHGLPRGPRSSPTSTSRPSAVRAVQKPSPQTRAKKRSPGKS